MPIFKVMVEETSVTRGSVIVEAENAQAAVEYANNNHEWLCNGTPDDGDYMATHKALSATRCTSAEDLPPRWSGDELAWNGIGNITINDLLQPNVADNRLA